MARLLSPASLSVDIAKELKKAVASRAAASLPGTYKPGPFRKSKPFRNIFFPSYSKHPFEDRFQDLGFSGFSVALLCAAIKRHAKKSLRSQMNQGKIDATINQFNNKLTPTIPQVYASAIISKWPDFARLYNLVRHDLPAARVHYRQALLNAAADHALWFASGQWKSPDYECFHHWIKYMALGASPRDVDALIQDIKRAGFPVPRVVDVRSWRSWTSYGYSPVSMKDIEGTVRGPITASTYLYTSAFVPSPSLAPVFIENGYALDFTARGNPGDPYRDPPRGGSCFDKGALVLMADRRTLTPVERLRPGDKIWSPAANAPVSIAVIAHPSVSGRSLHAINGKSDFRFTDTHPFVVHEDSGSDAHNACVDPEKLGLFSPTWSDLGTQKLSSSSIALIQIHLTENRTLTESEMRITSLDTVIPHVEGDHFEHWVRQVKDKPESHGILYDIILDKTELCPGDVPADYVAGTRDMLVRVGSELPPLAAADQNIVMIFRNIIKEISTISYSLDESLGSELSLPDYWHRLAVMREELRILEPLLRGNWLQASLSVARKVGSQSSPVMALVSGVSQGSLFRQEDGNPTAGNSGESEDRNNFV